MTAAGVMPPYWHPGKRVRVTALHIDGVVLDWKPGDGRVLVRLNRPAGQHQFRNSQPIQHSGPCNWWEDKRHLWVRRPQMDPIPLLHPVWIVWATPEELS